MKRKRKTQAERREETREQVLAAAARVFASRGFHGTSLEAIAEEAGFSRGAVYYKVILDVANELRQVGLEPKERIGHRSL